MVSKRMVGGLVRSRRSVERAIVLRGKGRNMLVGGLLDRETGLENLKCLRGE